MNTITRGSRGRRAALTATVLAVLGLGLAGCQTGAVDQNTTVENETGKTAAQTARSMGAAQTRYEGLAERYAQQGAQSTRAADASQARYEGLAEYWAERAQAADSSLPIVADRLDRQTAPQPPRSVGESPVVADRLDRHIAAEQEPRIEGESPVVADRLDTPRTDGESPIVADRLDTND